MSAINNLTRYKSIKGNPSADEQRSNRVEKWKTVSKVWRENELMKRRSISLDDGVDDLAEEIEMMDVTVDHNMNKSKSLIREPSVRLLHSNNEYDQLAVALKIAQLLQRKHNGCVIQDVITAGLVPRFIELIQSDQNSLLQLTVATILTDLTTQNVQAFIPPNTFSMLAMLLKSNPSTEFKGQVILILSNFASDSVESRDEILASGALTSILEYIEDPPNLMMLRSSVWAVMNLVAATHSKPDENVVIHCVPTLADLINHDDCEVIGDSCWALAYLCDGSHQIRQAVIETGACKRLVRLLGLRMWSNVVLGSVRALGAIVTGDDLQTQAVIDSNAIPALRSLLQYDHEQIRRQVCWLLSNICAGPHTQIQSLIDADVFPFVLQLFSNSTEVIEVEAGWVIKTSISIKRTADAQIRYLVSIGAIETLCSKLSTVNEDLLCIAISTLRTILFIADDYDPQFLQTGALSIIKNLQTHQNSNISKSAKNIVGYFPQAR